MELSDHDLRQLNEDYLGSLPYHSLLVICLKLHRDLKEARERLNQTPENSSRPPSSRPPWELKPQAPPPDTETAPKPPVAPPDNSVPTEAPPPPPQTPDGAEQDAAQNDDPPPKRKAGKQPGAPGHGRTTVLPITDEIRHRPDCCAACGESLDGLAPWKDWTACFSLDLSAGDAAHPGLHITHIKHSYAQIRCPCGHITRAEPGSAQDDPAWSVRLTERHLCGPHLTAFITCLSLYLGASRRKIQSFLGDRRTSTSASASSTHASTKQGAPLNRWSANNSSRNSSKTTAVPCV